jgi:hypothetical protein
LAGDAPHLAAALFVESIGWSLRGFEARGPEPRPDLAFDHPASNTELERLLQSPANRLREVGCSRETLERVHTLVLQRPFEATTRSIQETEQAALLLSHISRQLLRELSPAQKVIQGLRWRRASRCLALLSAIAGLVWLVGLMRQQFEMRADLSANRPWRASSSYERVCLSPQRHCPAATSYFFHTLEEPNPWLELDLAAEQQVSRLHVFNRRDCCRERASPLIVEVSTDHIHFREVSRNERPFDEWTARFAPVRARWVRLRVPRRSFLHLTEVRVLP